MIDSYLKLFWHRRISEQVFATLCTLLTCQFTVIMNVPLSLSGCMMASLMLLRGADLILGCLLGAWLFSLTQPVFLDVFITACQAFIFTLIYLKFIGGHAAFYSIKDTAKLWLFSLLISPWCLAVFAGYAFIPSTLLMWQHYTPNDTRPDKLMMKLLWPLSIGLIWFAV